MSLSSRLDLLELLIEPRRRPGLTTVLVRGGLTEGVGDFARAGDLHWERLPLESVDAFRWRCRADALRADERVLVIGGLDLDARHGP